MVAGLARRLRRAGRDGDGAMLRGGQPGAGAHARAATAHVHRLVLEAFVAAVVDCATRRRAALLGRVCDLYALSEMESDRGWFLEHGRLTPARPRR